MDMVHPVSGSGTLNNQTPCSHVSVTLSDFGDPGGITPDNSVSRDPDLVSQTVVSVMPVSEAVVNNIYVPPPCPPSDLGDCQVNTVYCEGQPPVVNFTLNPRVPPFCPRASLGAGATALMCTEPSSDTVVPAHTVSNVMGTTNRPQLCEVTVASEPDNFNVPEHLRELFEQTLERSQLSLQDQQHLADVLCRNSDAFAKSSLDIGFCPLLEHNIDTGDAKPIKQSPWRPPHAARDPEDAIIDEMLQTGVIEPSNSPWSSLYAW